MIQYITNIMRKDCALILLTVALLVAPYLYGLITHHYIASADEAYQVQAAERLSKGYGYTSSNNNSKWNDMSDAKYDYVQQWPIGYSLVVSLMLRAGTSVGAAAQSVKALTVILGLIAWYLFIAKIRMHQLGRLIFMMAICLIALRCAISTADFIIWALFPVLSGMMLDYGESANKQVVGGKGRGYIFMAGLLISIMVLIKAISVVFIMMGVLWIIMRKRGDTKAVLVDLLSFVMLPLLMTAGLVYTNHMYSGIYTPVSDMPFSLNYHINILEIIRTIYFTIIPEKVMIYLIQNIFSVTRFKDIIITFASCAYLLIICWSCYTLYKRIAYRHLIQWFMVAMITTTFSLFILTFLFCGNTGWTYFSAPRYYAFISPFPVLLLIALGIEYCIEHKISINSGKKFIRNTSILVTFLLCVSIAWGHSVYLNRKQEVYDKTKMTALADIYNIIQYGEKNVVVFSYDSVYSLLLESRSIAAYAVIDLESVFTEETYFSKPTHVFMICESDACLKNYRQISLKYGFEEFNHEFVTIFWKRFKTGQINWQS